MSTTVPSSTAGSSASCWALLKRWISSRKKTVPRPARRRSPGARHDLADLGAARQHRRQLLEGVVAGARDEARERRLARPRRPEQDHRVRRHPARSPSAAPCPRRAGAADRRPRRATPAACAQPAVRPERRARRSARARAVRRAGPWGPSSVHGVRICEEETARVLGDLIRFNTVNPPGNERPAAEYLRDYLAEAGFETELVGAEDDRPNLVATLRGRSRRVRAGARLPRPHRHGAGRPATRGRATRGRARCTTVMSGAGARSI